MRARHRQLRLNDESLGPIRSPFSTAAISLSRDTIVTMLCVLKHLVAGSGDFVYLMLAARDRQGDLRDKKVFMASEDKDDSAADAGNKVSDGSITGNAVTNLNIGYLEQQLGSPFRLGSLSGAGGDHGSSTSLLESLVCLLGEEVRVLFSSSEAELLTGLLAMLTRPLDGIPDSFTVSDSEPPQAKAKEDVAVEDQGKSSTNIKHTLKGRVG